MWFIVIIVVILLVIFVTVDLHRPAKFPPGPRGLPLVGNILDVQRIVKTTNSLPKAWMSLAEKYGSVVGLRLGLADPLIIVSGREAVLELLKRQEFDGRPNGFRFTHRTGGVKRGLLFADGQDWAEQRRFSERNLKEFGWVEQTMEEMILEDAVALIRAIEQESKEGAIRNLNKLLSLAVINSLWSIITGSRIDLNDNDGKIMAALVSIHEASKNSSVDGGILNHLPFLRHIAPKSSGFEALNQRLKEQWDFFSGVITSHKVRWQPGKNRDFIDVYLAEIEAHKDDPSSSFDEMQLISLLNDLFAVGVDTTSNTIGFTILYLTIHPEVQDKVHAEIDTVIGRNNLPSVALKRSLPYLNATLVEAMRLGNVGATTIPHRATHDTTLRGFEIKQNYMLLGNLMSVHFDKEHWGDPDNFRPERFIDENGEFVDDSWVIPFGAGRRKCLGERLARNSHFLFIACLLQKFRFQLPPGQKPVPIIAVDGFTQTPPELDIVVTVR